MTIPFNVATTILGGLSKTSGSMRLVILEDVPTKDVLEAEKANKGKLTFSNGALMGKLFVKNKAGGAKVTPIPNSPLDKWFIGEELARPTNQGHVFFVHSKVLVVDALSDDPLVCSGSANFSSNSLTANDENMLLIRGSTRVADIYVTEMDRIFRHFRARDYINASAAKGSKDDPLVLDTTDTWVADNYRPDSYKNNRRLLFFPEAPPGSGWAARAAADGFDPFQDEAKRASGKRKAANAKAKARKAAKGDQAATRAKSKKTKGSVKKSARKVIKRAAKKAGDKRSSRPVAKRKAAKQKAKKR